MNAVARGLGRWWRGQNARHWERLGGPEYAALALLPPAESARVWRAAWWQATDSPGTRLRIVLLVLPATAVGPVVLMAAQRAGLGAGGWFAAELLAHLILGAVVHRPLTRAAAELTRPFVRAELLAEYGG